MDFPPSTKSHRRKVLKPIKETLNSWTLLAFRDHKTLVFSHNHSNYRIEVPAIHVKGHEPAPEPPDMIVLRGVVGLLDNLQYSFEPFTEGMFSDPSELVDDPLDRQSSNIYKALKPHEGEKVSVRFPKSEGISYPQQEATLSEVTPLFAKLYVDPLHIHVQRSPEPDPIVDASYLSDIVKNITWPSYTKTISLSFIQYEEDDEIENRPRLVIDHFHWDHNS